MTSGSVWAPAAGRARLLQEKGTDANTQEIMITSYAQADSPGRTPPRAAPGPVPPLRMPPRLPPGVVPVPPGPGQESVWDYPRPPRLEPEPERVRVVFGGETLADTHRALRLLETAHPPTYYVPLEDVCAERLRPAGHGSACEWKGRAAYFDVLGADGRVAEAAAWTYPAPRSPYVALRAHVAFYAGPMDACYVGAHRAEPQPGGFYGGWITPRVVGPFKGPPGTWGW